MTMPGRLIPIIAALMSYSLLCCRAGFSQDSDASPKTPLATKQDIIQDRVQRLEDQMYRMIENLRAAEPQQARRLEKALVGMGELGIRRDLKELISLLEADRLDLAVHGQGQLVEELSKLLVVLMEELDDAKARQEEIERLEKFAKELEQLISEESRLEQLSQEAMQGADGAPADEAAAAAIEALIGRQEALRQATQKKAAGDAEARPGEELRQEQDQLTRQGEQLAGMLSEKGEQETAKLADAARLNMVDAVAELAEESYASAGDAQQDAIRDLQRALAKLTKRLQKEADRTDFEALAQDQAKTSAKTAELSEQMKGAQNASGTSPGTDHVDSGKQRMDQAGEDLQQQDAAAAAGQQQQAVRQLEEARRQVQGRIDQLKREAQEKKLTDLKETFQELLRKQEAINRATVELDAIPVPEWKRPQQLRAVEIGAEQRAAGDIAAGCLDILLADGTTTVLPQMVDGLRDQMLDVAKELAELRVGPPTQAAQVDIAASLGDILAVLEQAPQPAGNPDEGQAQEGQPGDPPLLPRSAELKLLAKLQQRVFARTKAYHRANVEDRRHLGRLAGEQERVARIAAEMTEKLSRPKRQSPEPDHD